MNASSKVFRAGTRNSPLALWQTQQVRSLFGKLLPEAVFKSVEITTPGDADRSTDLRVSPADFFTKTLDAALLNGTVDFAVHSAKDLPYPVADGLDWFWLPDSGDRRDVLIGSLEPKTIGVSSERRATYCAKRFPHAKQLVIRGNIEERIAQVDDGAFDLIVMAGVAMQRLGIEDRITEWIPLDELDTPEAQGALAITFRKNDPRMIAIRNQFLKSATFVGAGVREGHCTLDGIRALQVAEVCLYDALMDDALLKHLPSSSKNIYVGKRQGAHSQSQDEINQLLCDWVRKGKRVVRLKGGDAGIFGRLAEEVEALEALNLSSRVLPGISAMQTAAADTGLLLTRRGVARGFSVMTPRLQGGGLAPIDTASRAQLPVVFFMSIGVAQQLADELIADGLVGETPCAFVFEAGSDRETVLRGTLNALPKLDDKIRKLAGLFIVGEISRYGFDQSLGAFGGQRILLTCSEALMPQAVQAVHDFGGKPVVRPLIELIVKNSALDEMSVAAADWIALTSPSSVRCFHEWLLNEKVDFRNLPKIMTVGSGTNRALEKIGLGCDLMPESDFSANGLLEIAAPVVSGQKILRLRSQKAGSGLADGLRAAGAEVDDAILYDNRFVQYDRCPEFDTVFFASASAVESFIEQWGVDALNSKTILTMGQPTARALKKSGVDPQVIGTQSTVGELIEKLAQSFCAETIFPAESGV